MSPTRPPHQNARNFNGMGWHKIWRTFCLRARQQQLHQEALLSHTSIDFRRISRVGNHSRAFGILLITLITILACQARSSAIRSPGPVRSQDPVADPKAIRHALIVQIDGLSPDHLDSYLADPASRAEDRALHRLLGASQSSAGDVELSAAVRAQDALSVVPSLPDPASATWLTGLSPREHGVRTTGSPLRAEVKTLHQAIVASGGSSATMGISYSRGATFVAKGADDAARLSNLIYWLGLRPTSPELVTVRFEALAQALLDSGLEKRHEALGRIDEMLNQLLYGLGDLYSPHLLVVITSGHGAMPLNQSVRPWQREQLIQQIPELALRRLELSGGILRVPRGGEKLAAALAQRPNIAERVVIRTAHDLQTYDYDLQRFRAVESADELQHPRLIQRLLASTDVDDVVAIAQRQHDIEFTGESGLRIGRGGTSAAESRIPLIFAGAPLRNRVTEPLNRVELQDIALTHPGPPRYRYRDHVASLWHQPARGAVEPVYWVESADRLSASARTQ